MHRALIAFIGWLGLVVMLVLLSACSQGHGQGDAMSQTPQSNSDAPIPEDLNRLDGFPGHVSEGRAPEAEPESVPVAVAEPLSESATQALLARLDPLQGEAGDQQAFALRPGSRPPPRTGLTVQGEFPPADEREPPAVAAASGPFRVLRYGPEGEVPIAGQISVSFDRPMIAVTSHEDSVAAGVPLQLSPAVPGQWRWVGTRTLLFEPQAARLPMATEFQVSLDPQARAADGAEAAESLQWQFATPPPVLQRSAPQGRGIARQPLITLGFDQRIDPAQLLGSVRLQGPAGVNLPSLRLATAEEIAAEPTLAGLDELARQRTLLLKPVSLLPTETAIEVVVDAGAPSAEGPRRTSAAQRFGFTTHGPFRVIEQQCGWRGDCTPTDDFRFRFSNALAPDQDLQALVRIEPEFAGASINGWGNYLSIGGYKAGLRSYVVELSPELLDQHGQRLEGERRYSFAVGATPAALLAPGDGLITVDPVGPPRYSFHSVNLAAVQLRVFRVKPGEWNDYLQSAELEWQDNKPLPRKLPGKRVVDKRLEIDARSEEMVTTTLDLRPWLDGEVGHLIVELSPARPLGQARMPDYPQVSAVWLQITRIGLDAVVDAEQMHAWATTLIDGRPLADVELRLWPSAAVAHTDSTGTARLPLPPAGDAQASGRVDARLGEDIAFLPENRHYRSWGEWRKQNRADELRWHVFDDRGLYKPGETVHLKGWLRVVEQRPEGGLALPSAKGPLTYKVVDSRGNTLHEGQTEFAGLGGFALDFTLPDTPNLGQASVQLRLDGVEGIGSAQFHHIFQIQEFRTPEFEVSASFPAADAVYAGDTLHLQASAQYYAGGALPGAPVNWTLNATPTNYSPPNQSDYSFGIQQLWWRPISDDGEGQSINYSGQTDAAGLHPLAITLDRYQLPRPLAIGAQSTVQDLNRQAWTAVANTLVHPAANYVGLKTDAYFVERGQPLALDLIVVDLQGQPLADQPVLVEAGRLDWVHRGGKYVEQLADPQRCELRSDADGLARCQIQTEVGGQYRITAVTSDAQGRRNVSRILRWVSGGELPPVDGVEVEEISFIPDRDQYGPGDTARILIQAPFANGHGLLTLGRHGVLAQRSFQMQGSTHTLEIPIKREWLPNVELAVMVVGQAPRDADKPTGSQRPAQAVGWLNLKLSTAERRLDVAVQPEASALAPGAQTSVSLQVRDTGERPVRDAEVALFVVDEAILALGGYQLADPLELYYQLREAGVRLYHLRPTLRLNSDPDLEAVGGQGEELYAVEVTGSRMRSKAAGAPPPPPPAPMAAPMADAMMMDAAPQDAGAGGAPIAVRSDFNPLAAFVPALRTDADGRAVARFKLPDNLTRYRIMAVAVSGASHYGIGESQLTARLPLMLRPSPPRFLNFGDRFEFPLLLQNQTEAPLDVRLAVQTGNLQLQGGAGYAVQVPANDRVEVRIPMAADQAGTARFQIAAATADFADAARGQLPVWTPATTEAFASYGVIDEGALQQPIALPGAVWPQFGGLSVSTSSTALASLTDAYLYLHQYPFECTEQLASRIMATVALRDVLTAFEVPELASPEAIRTQLQRDLELLQTRQNPDGGFAFWRGGMEAWPYLSVHAAHALLRARDKGYPPSPQALQRSLAHLKQIERHIPEWYDDRSRRAIIAYALYVRALAGERDVARGKALLAEAGELSALSFESLGWLLAVLSPEPSAASEVAQIRRYLANRTSETAAGASFALAYTDGAHLVLHSERRADAIILDALIADQPDSDLIPKLVSSLQAHRVRGRWANTQENVFVLLALDRYFQRYESVTPDFVARTWLGKDFAGEHAFRGRSTERHQIDVPMPWLAAQDPLGPLLIAKDGPGRLYYRVGLDYAPQSLQLAPAEHGFEVQRRFEAIDDPADVQQLPDGRWQIRAGASIAVELTMIAPARRHHVALVDPLAAGLEVINPDLTPKLDPPGGPKPWWADTARSGRGWWWGPWYEHQNLRDNRVEAFASLLPGGVYSYRYEARATTPGEYIVPPAKAEEMYEPETFGRSGTDRVVVR